MARSTSSRKKAASSRRTKKHNKGSSSCRKAGHLTSPKTHKCVTCKAFSTKELKQFSNLLALSTRGKTRQEMCSQLRSTVNPSQFGTTINRLESRQKRVRDGRRRYRERIESGELPFGGRRAGRQPAKSIVEWAGMSSESLPFVGTDVPSTLSSSTIPLAPPRPASFGGSFGDSSSSALDLLGWSAGSGSAPSSVSSIDYIELDPEYSNGEEYYEFDEEEDDYSFLDEDYDIPQRAARARGAGRGGDWRDVLRSRLSSSSASFSFDAPSVPAAPPAPPAFSFGAPAAKKEEDKSLLDRITNFLTPGSSAPSVPSAPVPPAPAMNSADQRYADYGRQADAIQDFIRAYAQRRNTKDRRKPYYQNDSTRASAMMRDINETSNVTSDYNQWKLAPWDYDYQGIDTEGSDSSFLAALKKNVDNRDADEGFFRGLSQTERARYL